MRHFLISALFLGLVSGCSSVNLGPHRIDVQQGNALDQENVARLKPGLSRSQVRFLLGTPLVVDPFHADRWDYVYVNYKAGKLAEQKRITLFFEGETLARIEGDLPAAGTVTPSPLTATTAEPRVATEATLAVAESRALPDSSAPQAAPLPSPPSSAQPAALGLQMDSGGAQTRPDATASFSENAPVTTTRDDKPVLDAVHAWAKAWADRNEAAYLASYDASFEPQGGVSRVDWEARRHPMFSAGKPVELKIDSPAVTYLPDSTVTVTFTQFYRSDTYRDAVVKQLRMIEREGRWLIVEEKVLSVLKGDKR